MIAILLLAAGASTRMRGADKLLQQVEGEAVLRRQAKAALASGAPVYVTLPMGAPERGAALDGLQVTRVPVPDAREGMAASIRAGVAVVIEGAVMIVPGDMPEITEDDFSRLINAFRHDPHVILRATDKGGTPGHPVIFPRSLFPALANLRGDQGARAVLRANPVRLIALPGSHATTDLDTPEDWEKWRKNKAN